MLPIGWAAHLQDGTYIKQGEVPYRELFEKHLPIRFFYLVRTDTGEALIRVPLEPDDRVIYRRRTTVTLAMRMEGGEADEQARLGIWQVILQRPQYTPSGKTGDLDYFQAGVSERSGRVVRKKNDFPAPLDFPELFSFEREAGVSPPRRRV